MCGIVGYIDPEGGAAIDLEAMLGAVAHRGPDESRLLRQGTVGLGSARLALVGGPLLLLWPLAWLLIIKSSYGIGWGRAILVWLALVVIAVILVITLLVPLGLMAGGVLLLTP